jgi:hypothetical protein
MRAESGWGGCSQVCRLATTARVVERLGASDGRWEPAGWKPVPSSRHEASLV